MEARLQGDQRFRAQLTDSGTRVIKIFLHISKDEQLRRFEERLRNPLKRWKLSYEDFRNRDKWDQYVDAIEDMFAKTSTKNAPWHAIQGDNKPAARLETIKLIVEALARGVEIGEPPIDPKVAKIARQAFGNIPLVERRGKPRLT